MRLDLNVLDSKSYLEHPCGIAIVLEQRTSTVDHTNSYRRGIKYDQSIKP